MEDSLFINGLEIDTLKFSGVVQRFQSLHKQQIQRIQDALSPRKRDFLELLPLLFHVNHPMLPGFVSTCTPSGIHGYHPSSHALNRAAKLSKCFEFKGRPHQSCAIDAIYLMGSVGSIAYSNKSDFDIWLCHDPALNQEQLKELKAKACNIELWTESIGLESHFFLVNAEEFRAGVNEPLSTESCGGIQHHLLLEEFYRTSLYISGKIPAWWLIPPDQELNYSVFLNHLIEHRFLNIDAKLCIDFGGLERIPAEEFLGGTLWHLYKAIHSPHKSLLKLLLMESYAREFPSPDWLCTQLKSAIYSGTSNADELDSYLYMYRKVEHYLNARYEKDRLELARECFYLKINELLSEPNDLLGKHSRRRMILRVMVESWGWGSDRLKELDSRNSWNIEQILNEQRRISQEIINSYVSITRFAREHAREMRPQNAEIQLLGRCLHCALERKPGKIDILSRDGYQDLALEDLSLHEIQPADRKKEGWALYSGRIKATDTQKPEPLKKAYSLVEILAWLVVNDFYRKNKPIWLENAESALSQAELKNILSALSNFFGKHKTQDDDLSVYARPSSVKACLLLVNIGQNSAVGRDVQVISDQFDPFNFGAGRSSLIQSIDQVHITSWGEVLVYSYSATIGLFDSLCHLLNQSPAEPPVFECLCFSQNRGPNIARRIQTLEQDLIKAFNKAQNPVRYIAYVESKIICFEKSDSALSHMSFSDENELLAALSTPRPKFSQVIFDHYFHTKLPLACIYRKNREGVVQFFCLEHGKHISLFILDERGGLFYRVFSGTDIQLIIDPFSFFINAILQRYVLDVSGIEYYRISQHHKQGFEAHALDKVVNTYHKKLDIRVVGMQLSPTQATYSVFCDELEFSSMDHGRNLFPSVAAHILKLRQGNTNYPIYISDIDVPPQVLGANTQDQLQTLYFLKYKQKIESRLNR